MTRIFIDGQAGTTGLDIARRLAARTDLELIEIDAAARKRADARADCIAAADVVVACLPDAAARETARLAEAGGTRIIDASTAHRTAPGWVYGLPELEPGRSDRIAAAARVANPGCYPTGFLLLVRPLVRAGLLGAESALHVHALSGYSGGGRSLIEAHEAGDAAALAARPYALGLQHKHLPEMQHYAGLAAAPLFCPTVAHFRQGMLVQVPLFTSALAPAARSPAAIAEVWRQAYEDAQFVDVPGESTEPLLDNGFLSAQALNGSNRVELMVFGHDAQVLLVARLDNLGKGASGAAVQNLNLMLGLPEDRGLVADAEAAA